MTTQIPWKDPCNRRFVLGHNHQTWHGRVTVKLKFERSCCLWEIANIKVCWLWTIKRMHTLKTYSSIQIETPTIFHTSQKLSNKTVSPWIYYVPATSPGHLGTNHTSRILHNGSISKKLGHSSGHKSQLYAQPSQRSMKSTFSYLHFT